MKKNELKKIAMKIAALQKQLDNTTDSKKRKKIKADIISLSNKIERPEDFFAIDELVLKFLN